jgi:hypothetical protein
MSLSEPIGARARAERSPRPNGGGRSQRYAPTHFDLGQRAASDHLDQIGFTPEKVKLLEASKIESICTSTI